MILKHKNKFIGGLLTLFALQVIAPLLLFISIQHVKNSQFQLIAHSDPNATFFKQLVLTENEFKRSNYTNENEITYGDQLYDVHSFKKENGKYIFTVLADEKEKELQDLNKVAGENKSRSIATVIFAFMYREEPLVFDLVQEETQFVFPSKNSRKPSSNYLKVSTPPPDLHS